MTRTIVESRVMTLDSDQPVSYFIPAAAQVVAIGRISGHPTLHMLTVNADRRDTSSRAYVWLRPGLVVEERFAERNAYVGHWSDPLTGLTLHCFELIDRRETWRAEPGEPDAAPPNPNVVDPQPKRAFQPDQNPTRVLNRALELRPGDAELLIEALDVTQGATNPADVRENNRIDALRWRIESAHLGPPARSELIPIELAPDELSWLWPIVDHVVKGYDEDSPARRVLRKLHDARSALT